MKNFKGSSRKKPRFAEQPTIDDVDVGSSVFDSDEEMDSKFNLNESSDDDEANDSDKELQVAFREGLLKKEGLNMIVEEKRPIVNKISELKAKIAAMDKKLPWIESVDVTVDNVLNETALKDDFEREIIFYKQAASAVKLAIPRLEAMKVSVFRPDDYFAEMAKSDDHMQKVRRRLVEIQEGKQRQEAFRRIREEKKFASKVEKNAIERKGNEKKKLMEAVKKHKKGMKEQLENMLNNAKRMDFDEEDEGERSGPNRRFEKNGKGKGGQMNRNAREKKFGFGGQKKRSKQNDKASFGEFVFPGLMKTNRQGKVAKSSRTFKKGRVPKKGRK